MWNMRNDFIFKKPKTPSFLQVIPLVTDEGMTPRVLDIGLPAIAQEQDGHSKPKKLKTS
jgi:hypothetical protein